MLDCDHQLLVNELIQKLECKVKLPDNLEDNFFDGQGEVHDGYDERRRFVRRKCRTKGILELDQTLPQIERSKKTHAVITSDISRGGFGFYHFEQLFPGERAKLWLPTQRFAVVIARCTRIGENCYLIGAGCDKSSS